VNPPAPRAIPLVALALSALAAVVGGGGVWILWWRLGYPAGAFVPGLEGHGPDALAWPRLLAVWTPAAHLLFTTLHAWLARRPGQRSLRPHLVADQFVALTLALVLVGALLGLRGHPSWRFGLGAWYVLFISARTAVLLRALWVWLAATSPGAPRAGVTVLGAALVPYLLLGAHVTTTISATSDEPYYLLVAHSLVHDGDIDLANNLAERHYRPFYWDRLTAATPGVRATEDGRIYASSFQGMQVALLVPGYWLAGRLGAVATLSLAGALALSLTFRLALRAGASLRAAFLAWLGAAFSVPVLSYVVSPWPEMTGALCLPAAAFFLSGEGRRPRALAMAGLCLAGAVLVKTRLFVAAVPVAIAFVRRLSWRTLVGVGAALSAGFLVMAAYDSLAQNALVARRLGVLGPLGTLAWLVNWIVRAPTEYRGHLGLLLDQEFGVLFSAPVFALALAGVVAAGRERRGRLVLLLAGPFVLAWYLLGAVAIARTTEAPHWNGGFSPPGRFVAVALPLLAVCTALLLDRIRGRAAWTVVGALYALTLGHALLVSLWPAWRFQHGIGRATGLVELFRLTGIDAGRLLPSYIAPGPGWVAPGVGLLMAIALAGWMAAGCAGAPPPRGVGLAGGAVAGALALLVVLGPALVAAGRYPAVLGRGRGGVSFHGRIPVDAGAGSQLRERLVWAAQRPAVLELAPRIPRGDYRLVVRAGAQGEPAGVSLRIRAGDGVDTVLPIDAGAAPVWREREYAADVVWPGGRLPIRLELTGISRTDPQRFAYLDAIEVRRSGHGRR
jgi:hypothetical protein